METKKCTSCKEEKSLCFFNKNKRKKDGLNNICQICSRQESKKYYLLNKEKHKKVVKDNNRKQNISNRERLFNYYLNNPCVDCGEANPIVLECDHKGDKKADVSKLVSSGYRWETIQEELDKCEVRCANCHRKKTAIQFGWYKEIIKKHVEGSSPSGDTMRLFA